MFSRTPADLTRLLDSPSFYCARESEMKERVQTLKRQMAELAEHRRVFHVRPFASIPFLHLLNADLVFTSLTLSNTTPKAKTPPPPISKPSNP